MAIFEKFPYSDLHNLNLDWMINQFKEWEAKYAEYDDELNELKTAVEAAQAALDQDEQDLAAAITRLDNAIQALPATIREVVRQEIYPAVEEQLPAIVDAKLPDEVQSQLPDEFEDWMDEHFTEPPIDPTMTMAYGVPSARAAGNIFDYLQGLKIKGYTNFQAYVEMTEDGAGNWDRTGGYEGASNSMRCHFNVVGGLTYRLSEWQPAGVAPIIEDIVFGQGPIVSGAQSFTPVGYILHEDTPNYRVSGNTYDIPIPKGADLLLVNSKVLDGHPSGPIVKGPTFEFKGGSVLRGLSPVTGSTSLKFTEADEIGQALRDGRPVTFRFLASSQFGELYASVVAAKLVREYDLWDIVMLSDNDQLIKTRCDLSNDPNGYLRDITVVDLGGDPGPAPILNYSIVVNLTAGQNDTFTGDISLGDLQSALDDAESIWLNYPGATSNDYDLRQVVEYNQDLSDDTSLRIGVFSEDEYTVYSVVDDGNDGVTLTVVSETGIGGGPAITIVTPTATELQVLDNAIQTFIATAYAAGGNVVTTKTIDESIVSLVNSLAAAFANGTDVYIKIPEEQNETNILVNSIGSYNAYNAVQTHISRIDLISGISIFTVMDIILSGNVANVIGYSITLS